MKMKTMISIFAFFLTCVSINSNAQLKVPAPSPLQTTKQSFGLGDITIEYSRPSAKGRVIFGDLVPYDKVWRTGANASTRITFSDDVKIEGTDVKAGTYAIYSIPNKTTWCIMLYKDLTLGGNVADYKQENEIVRFKVPANVSNDRVETFTFNFTNLSANALTIELAWEKTKVSLNVTTDIDSRIMKNIETNVINDNRPYFQAASYYFENNKDLKQALNWATKATEQNPKAYWMMLLKAKIEYKLNDKTAGNASALKTVELALADKNDDYAKMAKQLMADNR